MKLLALIIWLLEKNPIASSFVAGFLSEDILLFLSVLSGADLISPLCIILFGFLGASLHDALCYSISRSSLVDYLKKKLISKERRNEISSFIRKYGGDGLFFPLVVSKFIYGARVATILYVGNRERKFRRFLIFNTISLLVWFTIMVPLAWLAGRGFIEIFQLATKIEKFLLVLVVSLFLLHFGKKYLTKLLNKKEFSQEEKLIKDKFGRTN
jgi:membrane protein DedA with SNARE-associated domain